MLAAVSEADHSSGCSSGGASHGSAAWAVPYTCCCISSPEQKWRHCGTAVQWPILACFLKSKIACWSLETCSQLLGGWGGIYHEMQGNTVGTEIFSFGQQIMCNCAPWPQKQMVMLVYSVPLRPWLQWIAEVTNCTLKTLSYDVGCWRASVSILWVLLKGCYDT